MVLPCSRGETQALVVTTLGTGDDEQIIDALHGNFRSNFLLHYNFPPYSVGEVGRVGATGKKLATASWHGEHSKQCCQQQPIFHIQSVLSQKLLGLTDHLQWPLFVEAHWQ